MMNSNTNTAKTATRAEELKNLMTWAIANGYTGSTIKLNKVYDQWTAKRERPATSQPSKTALENKAKAQEVFSIMPVDEPVTNLWVCEHVNGISTTNKAAVIMGILVNAGLVTKCKVGKVMTYTRA